jgi:hypothetical protein
MNAQAKAGKPLWEDAHELLRVRVQFAADDKVIRKAGQKAAPL